MREANNERYCVLNRESCSPVRRLNLTQWGGPLILWILPSKEEEAEEEEEAGEPTIYQRVVGRDLTHSLKLRAMVFLSSEAERELRRAMVYRAAPRRERRRGGLAGEAAERGDVHTCTSGHSRVGSRLLKAARWMPLAALKRAFLPTSRLHPEGFVSNGCAVKFCAKGDFAERESLAKAGGMERRSADIFNRSFSRWL